jgi:glycerol-3-phosphate acyltransferase PlsY
MTDWGHAELIWLWLAAGYLAGSFPTAYIAVKAMKKIDIRTFGSGNMGATNAGRLLGKKWAVAIALFDMFKGAAAVMLASFFTSNPAVSAMTGLCAALGHNYPIWLSFKGGKGVASTFGVFAFFDFFNPWPALLGGVFWYLTMRTTRYVSIASIFGIAFAALMMPIFKMPRPYWIAAIVMAALITWRHRSNLRRIMEGTEVKTGQKR